MELVDLLMRTVEKKGSDLFLIPGAPATAKVGGALVAHFGGNADAQGH